MDEVKGGQIFLQVLLFRPGTVQHRIEVSDLRSPYNVPCRQRKRVAAQLYSFYNLDAGWGVSGQRHSPADLPPGKGHVTHCTEGLMSLRAGLNGCGKYHPHRDSISEPFKP